MTVELPDRRFEVTLPAGFARAAATDVVRTQFSRWQAVLGYVLLAALIVLGAVTAVWPAVVLGVVVVVIVLVTGARRISSLEGAFADGGLTDGQRLVSEYASEALTIRGDERSGTVKYVDVWEIHRYRYVVDLELRKEHVRHILPVELVPAEMESRFPGKDAILGKRGERR